MNFTILNITRNLLTQVTKKPAHDAKVLFYFKSKYSTFKSSPSFKSRNSLNSLNIFKSKLSSMKGIHENISALQMKKRPIRKKRTALEDDEPKPPGVFSVAAFATAEEYKLEPLFQGLIKQDLYEPKIFVNRNDSEINVIHAMAKYQVEDEPREIFFFREGTIVLWNVGELESSNLLNLIKSFEQDRYGELLVQQEAEIMDYRYSSDNRPSYIENGDFILLKDKECEILSNEKYAFSNAMALSVKLGMWEASLDRYVESIAFVTEDLKRGNKISMTQDEVLRKHGELFALRHLINLSSDLLDTPDFYWERDQLEVLYTQTCNYFSIPRRTKVMNEKLNHCFELIELLSSHLSDKHHTRLEWMIIILIMVEVVFETIHYAERYLH